MPSSKPVDHELPTTPSLEAELTPPSPPSAGELWEQEPIMTVGSQATTSHAMPTVAEAIAKARRSITPPGMVWTSLGACQPKRPNEEPVGCANAEMSRSLVANAISAREPR